MDRNPTNARIAARELARLIVVDETYPELRALLARMTSPKLATAIHLRRNFPAWADRHAHGEFSITHLLDALDEV